MKHKTHKRIFFLNLAIILLGGALLSWYYFIDGKITNPPLTYPNTDIMNFQLDKEVYKVGDTPYLYVDFCKTRNARGTTEWTLVDGQKVQFSPSEPREIAIGCYPQSSGGKLVVPLKKIPLFIEDTCDAYFTGVGRVELSGGREVIYNYRTETFCVDGGEEELLEVINK